MSRFVNRSKTQDSMRKRRNLSRVTHKKNTCLREEKNGLVFKSHQFPNTCSVEKARETTTHLQLPVITNWRIFTGCHLQVTFGEGGLVWFGFFKSRNLTYFCNSPNSHSRPAGVLRSIDNEKKMCKGHNSYLAGAKTVFNSYTSIEEFKPRYWVPHSYGLVPHLSKKLSKLLNKISYLMNYKVRFKVRTKVLKLRN